MTRVFVALVVVVTACEQPREVAPSVRLPNDARIDAVPADAMLADAAPPDAGARPVHCKFEMVNADELMDTYTFHGIVPWVDLNSPVTSECCQLPSSKVLCMVTEKVWSYIPVGESALAMPSYIEHARLFEKSAKRPTRDVVLSVFHPGPMNDPYGKASPPLFTGRVEMDTYAFRIVTKDDRLCKGRSLKCDDDIVELGACRAYRRQFAPLVNNFCAGLGETPW